MRHAPWGLIDKIREGRLTSLAGLQYGLQFHGRLTSLAGLQYQHTGYSYNLVGVVSPYWPWRSPRLPSLILSVSP